MPLDSCIVTRFRRTRDTAEIALTGREIPIAVEPLLGDVDVGDLEGLSLDDYRAWKLAHARAEPFRTAKASTRSPAAAAERSRGCSRGPRRRTRDRTRDPDPLRAQRRRGIRRSRHSKSTGSRTDPILVQRGQTLRSWGASLEAVEGARNPWASRWQLVSRPPYEQFGEDQSRLPPVPVGIDLRQADTGHVTVVEINTPHGVARPNSSRARATRGARSRPRGCWRTSKRRISWQRRTQRRWRGFAVALVEQPYRVAGRRSSASAPSRRRLDRRRRAPARSELAGLPLVVGGRSLGARVACRTADATGAIAVLCLAFPLEPPQRAGKPPKSRLPELDAVTVPTLVVQGERDRFGMPHASTTRKVGEGARRPRPQE